jgi:hypothetical protein
MEDSPWFSWLSACCCGNNPVSQFSFRYSLFDTLLFLQREGITIREELTLSAGGWRPWKWWVGRDWPLQLWRAGKPALRSSPSDSGCLLAAGVLGSGGSVAIGRCSFGGLESPPQVTCGTSDGWHGKKERPRAMGKRGRSVFVNGSCRSLHFDRSADAPERVNVD